MTPAQQKAKELVDRMYIHTASAHSKRNGYDTAKLCALICVENEYSARIEAYNELSEFCPDVAAQAVFYAEKELNEVKQAIREL